MASAEQPLKKRKLHEPSQPTQEQTTPSPQEPPPQSPHPQLQKSSFTPPSPPLLSQEEILRRRRSQEEIRNVYECYKRIKFCINQDDKRFMPDLEQAYLSLISAASRGLNLNFTLLPFVNEHITEFSAEF